MSKNLELFLKYWIVRKLQRVGGLQKMLETQDHFALGKPTIAKQQIQ